MTDIQRADKPKMLMRFLAKYARGKLKETGDIDVAISDLNNSTNHVFRKLYRKLKEAGNHIKERHQRAVILDIGGFGLWTVYKDTAYDDPFIWMLWELYNDPSFMEALEKAVKQPPEWYCNRWHDTKETTERDQARGKLTRFDLAPDENIFVPAKQEKIWVKELTEMVEKEQRMRGRK